MFLIFDFRRFHFAFVIQQFNKVLSPFDIRFFQSNKIWISRFHNVERSMYVRNDYAHAHNKFFHE